MEEVLEPARFCSELLRAGLAALIQQQAEEFQIPAFSWLIQPSVNPDISC